ncbi:MAG: MgtC/SapB family protein [Sediminimonas sp.]|uniref:Protein MgtC n=1 Tax=Sediminimonas qiaohouensis TaxID=552061 RepID=A0A7C9HPR2_9RHOB|nr:MULTISPECIES: MgtC/SapB family protein [Sediminimonas]MDR9484572.1 MgtC/SapB family protein [Sediminimonas sp.]MTJ05703.1 MgtC/SapB family protein [Sediminimonas qiaohouensis]
MEQHVVDAIAQELSGTFSAVSPLIAGMRLVAALIFGGVIGLERESKQKPAGLRTHMLVSMAACLFILVSQQLAALSFGAQEAMRVDPLRLIEAVTAGVAFLAAGAIFTSGGSVHNITTGASMWLVGAIGLACGSGQMPLAAMATGIVLLVLYGVRLVER